jgi:hypothetical protein
MDPTTSGLLKAGPILLHWCERRKEPHKAMDKQNMGHLVQQVPIIEVLKTLMPNSACRDSVIPMIIDELAFL